MAQKAPIAKGEPNVFFPAGNDLLGPIVTTAADGTVSGSALFTLFSFIALIPFISSLPLLGAVVLTYVPEIVIEFGPAQSIGALREAAYRLISEASCVIDTIDGRHICRIIPKERAFSDGTDVRSRFLDLVTDQNLREKVFTETAGVRHVIVALAFGALARERDGPRSG